ncbi:MAG: hypothetical protein QW304_08815 [Thermoproteota archaeon]
MATVRCEKCGLKLSRAKRNYVAKVKPLGYPNTAVICGLSNCENPGIVWLENHEYEEYKKGHRIFRIPSFATKIRVE